MLACAHTESALYCHPDTLCPAVGSIKAAIGWEQDRALKIVYTLRGALGRLRLPPYQCVRRGEGLWRHSCFELFICARNDAEYYEFNFSPSGEWSLYGFRDYRDGGPIEEDELDTAIAVAQAVDRLELSVLLRADRLPGITRGIRLAFGVSAVIEDMDESLSYWALKHPLGTPDFHHADNFALELVVPR
jgi:hypothetical protein